MTDLDNHQRSPKFGQGLLLDGESLSKLASNPIFQRLSKNRWVQKFPPWAWGGLALGGLFAVIWVVNSRLASPPTSAAGAVGGDTTALAVDILVKLSLIVGLIYGVLWVFRRWRGADLRSGVKKVDVLETVHLSPRRAIHLVQAGEQVILIGATDQNITFLSDIEADQTDPAEQPGPVFADVLAKENETEHLNGRAINDAGTAKNGQGNLREVVCSETTTPPMGD